MNILFSGLLLLSTNILQGYGQVISDSRDLTGTFNRNLTLSWTFSSKKDFAILTLTLYKDNTNSENKIYQGEESKELTSKGKAIFGERFVIEKNDWSAGVFISKLKNVQFNDTGRVFILRVVYEDGAVFTPLKSSYTITKVIGPGGGTRGGSSGDSNAGLIAGVIIGLIFLIIIVVVCFVLFKRYKKNKRSSHLDGSDTKLKCSTNEDEYPKLTKEYADVGPGAGDDEPKPLNPTHEVKHTDDDDIV